MLVVNERFDNVPVMSLQTGSELARTSKTIIDPRNLTIVAFELEGRLLTQQPSLLLIQDIREVGPLGMIIDSTDELIHPDDVVKISEIYGYEFDIINLKVIDDRKKHIGRVTGYSVDSDTFVIQQINVKKPLLQSLNESELLIHRSQIIKVTDNNIIVKSPTVRSKQSQSIVQGQAFDNPFRKTVSSQSDITQ